jgi:tRNA dimethylallyltransferase
MTKRLISVVGPTAIGKTKLAIALAQHYETDIISADSRQFFKEMEIGTAVPSLEELNAVNHHFIQHKSVLESYSVGDFEKDAIALLETLFKTKDFVILVGGSGLYVDAVTKGLDNFPKVDPEIRVTLNKELEEHGIAHLQNQLKKLDPEYHAKVDLDNPHRLVRALEVCLGSGKAYSSFLQKEKPKRPFSVCTIGINAERETIYNRINRRVDLMMNAGLLKEVASVYDFKDKNALRTVGYKELIHHLDGESDLEFAISEIKKNTRRFAKRQLTWFRRNKETLWVDYLEEVKNVVAKIENQLEAHE